MKAWHFSDKEKKLRYGDGRDITVGTTHTVDCEPELCRQGLHGSVRLIDALNYAPGPIVWRVEITGKVKESDDKIVGQSREYLAGGIDISDTLREFARWCALQVIDKWDAPDVVVEYLKTGKEELRDAARASARAAVMAAEWEDAWAERYAAMEAVMAAARDASWDAARSAAWAAMKEKQNKKLTDMVEKLLEESQ